MPATDDRWDVVVVGLRDPSAAAAMMAVAELAHYASLPPQDVENMLEEGELPVLENLDRAEAERAAYELAELGAVVDLRLAMGDSGVFPVFKPDAERQIGVAVGGLIDDSATPPTVGAALGLPELEPDPETPQEPRPRPTRPPTASRPPAAGPVSLDDEPSTSRSARPAPDPRASEQGAGARGRSPTPAPSGAGDRARKPTPEPTARGNTGRKAKADDVESMLVDIGSAPAGSPKLPERLQRASAAAAAVPAELEVDFAAAGIAPPPKRGFSAPAPAPAPTTADRSSSHMPRRTRAGHMGGTGASAAGHVHRTGGTLELLRSDGAAMLLVGLCVGLALSLVLALQIQRSSARDTLPALEEELAAALADPADVAAGKRRDPAKIQAELDDALDGMQRKFFLWWLGPGLLVGILISRFKEE